MTPQGFNTTSFRKPTSERPKHVSSSCRRFYSHSPPSRQQPPQDAASPNSRADPSAATHTANTRLRNSSGRNNSPGGVQEDIHQENLARVLSMSPQEVEEAQQEIFSTLSPASLDLLRRRGRAQATGSNPSGGRNRCVGAATAGGNGDGDPQTGEIIGAPSSVRGVTVTAGDSLCESDAPDVVQTPASALPITSDDDTMAAAGHTDRKSRDDPPSDIWRSSAAGPAGGAPTGAQRAATRAGGIDSEESLAAALQYLPWEERVKSSWTVSVSEAGTRNDDQGGGGGGFGKEVVRVDLDGVPVGSGVVVSAGAGGQGPGKDEEVVMAAAATAMALYHHGDDPEKPGYTPTELIRLAR